MAEFFGSTTPFAEPLWYSRPGSSNYGDSHRRLRDEVRRYVDNEIKPFYSQWEAMGSIPVLKRHSKLGYTAILLGPSAVSMYHDADFMLPGNIPPQEWDSFHNLIATDEIARCSSLGVIWALGCGNMIGCTPIVYHGNEEQKSKWLPSVLRHEISFCQGITEPCAGSDVASISMKAERRGEVFVINGIKDWVTNGMYADFCTAAVRTDDGGAAGISVIVIPLNVHGVSRTDIPRSGVALGGVATLTFKDVEVPVNNIIGVLNEGFKLIMVGFNQQRLWIAGNCLRLARVCLEDAYKYALTRQTFGRPLIERQTIKLKFSNIGMQIVSTYALLESVMQIRKSAAIAAANGNCNGSNIGGLCALTKVSAARATELSVRECQQIMGAAGYAKHGPGARIEQISRDVRVLVIGGGSDEILSEMSLSQERKDLEKISSLHFHI
ncbi:related to acyl-CoA dehydrogenase [Rhynchosporium agropyri]|uniref:Related to acyl-CoA dehydrogenase n=1 Tax=Rhynchosporium agropyri TaxID=914238 RepID=A0A1E1LTV8_9HELO|nr:related to acyl-CoA dehydrogenase [Rhynchosporium agropyri]